MENEKAKRAYREWLSNSYSEDSQGATLEGFMAAYKIQQKIIDAKDKEIERLQEMIDLGLGWEDMANYDPDDC